MPLDRDKLARVLQKTAYAAPMTDPMAVPGAPPAGAPPAMPAAPPMDPAAMGAPPMDPAMAGGMPPMDPAMAEQLMAGAGGAPPMEAAMDPAAAGMAPAGPEEAMVGAVGEEQGPGTEPAEPSVAEMSVGDLQAMIADTVAAAMEAQASGDEMPGQMSEMQDEIAGIKELGGAIPTDSPSMELPEMPMPDMAMEEGMSDEVPPEAVMPKVAAEQTPESGELLATLKRMRTLR